MSKDALRKLSAVLNQSDPKKDFRNKTINPLTHGVNTRATSIFAELKSELTQISRKEDKEIFNYISDADIKAAASKFRAELMGQVRNPKTGVSFRDSKEDYIVGTFSAISSLLQKASQVAVDELKNRVASKTTDYVPFLGKDKLVNLDHTRTVGETRVVRDITNSKLDVLSLITALKSRPLTSKVQFDEIYNNILEINSYYSNPTTKVFEITGTVDKPVEGQIRSGRANQQEGAEAVKLRVNAFKKAVELAIKDYDWPAEAASDSFQTAAFKELSNAVVRAGGSGKVQTIDRTPNKASNKKQTKEKRTVTNVKMVTLSSKKRPEAKQSALSIQRINDYINARLPPVVRSHMGPQSLENRTGRFSESARIVNGIITPQNYISLAYTYQRDPYDVFDPILGAEPWNTPSRNPRNLIEKSIREIAQDLAIGRFYLRRV